MKESFIQNPICKDSSVKSFLWMFSALLLLTAPILFYPKENFSLWLNSLNKPILDSFFYYITYLGDGLVFIPVFIFLLFRSYVLSGLFAFFVAFEAFIVQLVLKRGVFAGMERPSAYIPNFEELHQVAGVDLYALNTFPSGHTQSVFLVAFFLVLGFKKGPWLSFLLLALAAFTGLSRVYILQHFFVDVWFGALIGLGIPVLTIYLLQKYNKLPSSHKSLLIRKE